MTATQEKTLWNKIKDYEDIFLEKTEDGIGKITINRPQVRNAFRPETVVEIQEAFDICRNDSSIGVIILTGQGHEAFPAREATSASAAAKATLEVMEYRASRPRSAKQIRSLPKPVVAMVAGYAIGGGTSCTSCAI